VSVGLTLASPAKAIDKDWRGNDLAPFSVDDNWVQGTKPGPNDRGINQQDERILYDDASGTSPYTVYPYVIQRFWGDSASALVFERYNDPTNGTPRALQVTNGLSDAPPNPNDHEIKVGPHEALWIGDPVIHSGHGEVTVSADIDGYAVTVDGGPNLNDESYVGVTGSVGAGAWNVNAAEVGVGYAFVRGGAGDNWLMNLNSEGSPLGSSFVGAIDSGVTDPISYPPDPDSMWTLEDSRLQCKRAQNLGHWLVVESGRTTRIYADEYFEVRSMEFKGRRPTDRIKVGAPDFEGLTPHGMRVLQWLGLTVPAGLEAWQGTEAEVGELIVARASENDPQAILSMDNAALVYVNGALHEPEDESPTVLFSDASILWYGPLHEWWGENDYDYPIPDQADLARNWFCTHSSPTELTPIIVDFDPTSYIGPRDGELNPPNDLLMHIKREGDFRIRSEVSELPARAWNTSDTDVMFQGLGGGQQTNEMKFEVIAPDNCEVWFVDVPEPRCLKHFRVLVGKSTAGIQLVDNYDNHICGTAPDTPDGALYVVRELIIESDSTLSVTQEVEGEDDRDIQVYFGIGDVEDVTWSGAKEPKNLVFSVYGDFDGDGTVDYDDYYAIYSYISAVGDHCGWPNADFDGDCVVDLGDLAEVGERYNNGECYKGGGQNCVERDPIENCPFLPGGDGPEQGGQESEEVQYVGGQSEEGVAAFANAVLGYLVKQDPQDSGEEDTVQHMIDSFDKLTAMYFDADQKAALADVLEQAEYTSDTVVERTAAFIEKLRG
jgi:hypothetical protein